MTAFHSFALNSPLFRESGGEKRRGAIKKQFAFQVNAINPKSRTVTVTVRDPSRKVDYLSKVRVHM